MNKTFKSFFYKIGILLILILLVVIYDHFMEVPSKETIKNSESPSISSFATDIHIVQYQENGTVNYQMTAEKLIQMEKTDISYLTNPTANIYKNSAYPWFIRSDKGEIGPKGKTVKLINNVKGTQVDEKGQTNHFEIGQTKNDTDPIKYGFVMIYPDKKYAESKDFTTISSNDGLSSGMGVRAYFDKNRLQLLSKVKTQITKRPE